MFQKSKLKKAIKNCQKRIALLEQKRARSQAALVEAILRQIDPDDTDVEYFNQFTEQIEQERNRMHDMMRLLDDLK